MAIRVVRHIGARSVDEDEAILLAAIPYGAGERIRHVRMDAFAATRAASFADQPSEINWLAVDVPWAVLLTHSAVGGGTGGPAALDTAAEWDTIFRNLMLEYGTDGNEYYGGDAHASTPDVVLEPSAPGNTPAIEASMGPSGIHRILSREVLMRPLLAEGESEIRWFDEFNVAVSPRVRRESGGVLLIGVVRYTAAAQTNFGVEFDADQALAMKALIGGDMQRIRAMIQSDTSSAGDALRTMLFGGDNYVEADTLKADDAKAYIKVWASVETPYSMMLR